MAKLYNMARMTTATTGTGTITLGSAAAGFQSFAAAGVQNGETVSYAIKDGTAWEIGRGVYTSSGTTLSRTVLASSNGGAAINLSGSAEVFISALAEDFDDLTAGGGNPTIQVFTSSGTWNRPTGCTMVKITITGGGAGGGGVAASSDASVGGGGSGATVIKYLDVSAISSAAVTIGSGGSAGASSGGNGGSGGNSSFGSSASAGGGSGNSVRTGGNGGTVLIAGDVNIPGSSGGGGSDVGDGSQGGIGGASFWGGGAGNTEGIRAASDEFPGKNATVYGGGGSGATVSSSGTASAGGAGFAGFCTVEEYYG